MPETNNNAGHRRVRDTSEDGPSSKRKRLSCAECRRLKLKCDRQVPCSNCVRRRRVELCPDGPGSGTGLAAYNSLLEAKVAALEGALKQKSLDVAEASGSSGSSHHSPTPAVRQRPSTSRSPLTVVDMPPQDQDIDHDITLDDAGLLSPPQGRPQEMIEAHEPVQAHSFPKIVPSFQPPSHLLNAANLTPSEPAEQSFGTLVLTDSGRSKWLGPTAASDWLKDQEMEDHDTPPRSRAQSPTAGQAGTFPFSIPATVTTDYLLSKLPPVDEARVYVDSYYKYFGWHYDVCPRYVFDPIFQKVYYEMLPSRGAVRSVSPQELAIVFITMAFGSLHDLELPPNDPVSVDFYTTARLCLVKGKFLIHNTLAGVRTLLIMGHYCLQSEEGRNGDTAWPIWGLAMRTIQAMGLHRDGTRWNLPHEVVEERRRVFWECQTADVLQANCFSRSSTIPAHHIDCAFPNDPGPERSFSSLKFEVSVLGQQVLDFAMDVRPKAYSAVLALHERIAEFENSIPYSLRFRAALLARPSRYSDPADAMRDSPEESRRDVQRTLQQYTLALNICEIMMSLHRQYYVHALHETVADPTMSIYGQSYLTIVERCNMIVLMTAKVHALHPNVSARHWYIWYHLFTAAVCAATLVIENPRNPLAPLSLALFDNAITLYSSVVQGNTSTRIVQNLKWLQRLRQRAGERMRQAAAQPQGEGRLPLAEEEDTGINDAELLGWRTRLVKRAVQGRTAMTVGTSSPATTVSPDVPVIPSVGKDNTQSAEDLLQEFWEPLLLPNVPSMENSVAGMFTWDLEPPSSECGALEIGCISANVVRG